MEKSKYENSVGITPWDVFKTYANDKKAIDRISVIAYGRSVPGLTDEECEQLEALCDKAYEAYTEKLNEVVVDVLRYVNETIKQQKSEGDPDIHSDEKHRL